MVTLANKNGEKTAHTGRDGHGRFVHGHPGVPGRPTKELSITEQLRVKAVEASKDGEPARVEQLAEQLWDIALKSNDPKVKLEAAKLIADRIEGRPRTQVDVTSGGDTIKSYPIGPMDEV